MARNLYPLGKQLVDVARTQQLPFLAAAIAYYAFLSVVPLLLLVFTFATIVAGQAMATELVTAIEDYITPEAADLVEQTLVGAPGRGGFTIASLAVVLWGSLRIFRGLDIAFSRVYGQKPNKPLQQQVVDASVVVLGILGAIAVTILSSVLLTFAPIPFSRLASTLGVLLILPIVFFPLYYIFPAKDVTLREALPGTVFAGLGWAALSVVFGVYTTYADGYELYGVLGGVLLLLIWFYFGGIILLAGAALNAVLAGRHPESGEGGGGFRDRQVQQEGPRDHSQRASMTDNDEPEPDGGGSRTDGLTNGDPVTTTAGDPVTQADIDDLRDRLDDFEDEIEDRTVHRAEVERDLKRYVRGRMRRGRARGWGPYLVLLYGTAMTLGAFYFLSGGWAVLAMLVIWLSTLGLYTLMIIVGMTFSAVGLPFRLLDKVRDIR